MPKLLKIIDLLFPLQHVKKEVSDAVDFLIAEKYESFLQIENKMFDGVGQAFPKFPK